MGDQTEKRSLAAVPGAPCYAHAHNEKMNLNLLCASYDGRLTLDAQAVAQMGFCVVKAVELLKV